MDKGDYWWTGSLAFKLPHKPHHFIFFSCLWPELQPETWNRKPYRADSISFTSQRKEEEGERKGHVGCRAGEGKKSVKADRVIAMCGCVCFLDALLWKRKPPALAQQFYCYMVDTYCAYIGLARETTNKRMPCCRCFSSWCAPFWFYFYIFFI